MSVRQPRLELEPLDTLYSDFKRSSQGREDLHANCNLSAQSAVTL